MSKEFNIRDWRESLGVSVFVKGKSRKDIPWKKLEGWVQVAINEKLEREGKEMDSFNGIARKGDVGRDEIVVENEWYWLGTSDEKDKDGSDLSLLTEGKKYRVTIEEI